MNLLPKSELKFAEKEYWDEFFRKRNKKDFEWYGEYPELCGNLHKYIKAKDNILVVGCGNSKLSANLYDVGYTNILNIDISPVVIKQMKQMNRDRKHMRFEVADALNMNLNREEYSVVIDKGTLDALMPQSLGEDISRGQKLLSEVDKVLKLGGRYVIISLLQEHILKVLLKELSALGWLIRILRCHEVEERTIRETGLLRMPVFLVIATKFKKLPNSQNILEIGLTSDGKISRVGSVDDVIKIIKEAQEAVAVCSYVQQQNLESEMKMEFMRPLDTTSRYIIYVVDDLEVSNNSYGVFIVPVGREVEWLFGTTDGRKILRQSTDHQRLAIVILNRDHSYESLRAVQEELSPYVLQLAPKGHPTGVKIPYMTVGEDLGHREIVYRGKSQLSGEFIIEDVVVDNTKMRRLVFVENQAVVQSEARLIKKGKKEIIDHSYLVCPHHCYMTVCATKENLKILILGLGGGCLASFLHFTFPNSFITAVEIDADVVEVAKKFFHLQTNEKLIVHVADGLEYLKNTEDVFDLILLDVNGKDAGSSILAPPLEFLESNFLQTVKSHLSDTGLYVVNVVSRLESDKKLIENQLQQFFNFIFTCSFEEDVNELFYSIKSSNISFDDWKKQLLKNARDLISKSKTKDIIDLNHFTRSLNLS